MDWIARQEVALGCKCIPKNGATHERVEKSFFRIEQDADGYPPVGAESLWARQAERVGEYVLENIPFFSTHATLGDLLKVVEKEGVLWFDGLIKKSGNSLIRVVFFNRDALDPINQALMTMGCLTEYSKDFNLLATSIPEKVNLTEVQSFLADQEHLGFIDYEEPILRQD
ncbi:DUF4265 domain-containing protein [Luteibacter aegosomatis]|uniref:DUF4265 domain-containing protein n=1 Tax=Luteibacter aegosomatis TaxID=2911537 RepID=UPI001FF78C9A|nr:DUF4265 domain-containing protein [Luteibacter aegosomatis]UPG85200.1 DUF4265 domain-containing protein [Luteibacter aegosomatis]